MVGLGALARSGRPNNTLGAHPVYGQSESFILPRGSAGRTPAVTRFDLHLGYRRRLSDGTFVDAFIDIYKLFNQRTALLQDQDYTLDPVEPIIGGDKPDLPHLENVLGAPVTRNPNYLARPSTRTPSPAGWGFGCRSSGALNQRRCASNALIAASCASKKSSSSMPLSRQ